MTETKSEGVNMARLTLKGEELKWVLALRALEEKKLGHIMPVSTIVKQCIERVYKEKIERMADANK